MSILLVDLYHSGHHLEFASSLREGLSNAFPDRTVDYLTTSYKEIHNQYFDPDEVTYIYDYDVSDRIEVNSITDNVYRAFKKPRDEFVRNVIEHSRGYDIVHFLHIDDIIRELDRHGTKIDATIFANLIGGFFRQTESRVWIADKIISAGIDDLVGGIVPDILSRRSPWNLINLNHALQREILDDVFVNSKTGRNLIHSTIQKPNFMLPTIPDPAPPWFETEVDKTSAREQLGLPQNRFILTYFGEIREEKGVDILLKSLERYDGPPLSCVIAGDPVSLDPSDFLVKNNQITLHTNLQYIPQEDIRSYYSAADCIVLPYKRSFGRYRRSGTFQKACTADRPIIAPDFGQFAVQIPKNDLGLTFEPESSDALASVIKRTVEKDAAIYDSNSMREYVENHTYDELVEVTAALYRKYL